MKINYDGIVEIKVLSEVWDDTINNLLSVGWKLLEIHTLPRYETVGFFRLRQVQVGTKNEFVLGRPKEIPKQNKDEGDWEYIKRLRKR